MILLIFVLLISLNILGEETNTKELIKSTNETQIEQKELANEELAEEKNEQILEKPKEEIYIDSEIQEPIDQENEESNEIEEEQEEEKIEYPIGKLELLDKIEAEVITSTPDTTDTEIITTSDIRKRSFDGSQYKLDDLIDELLADNLGKTFKINLTDDDVNKHLKRMKLSDKSQLAKMVETWGFNDLPEFYETFKKIYRASSALHYEMSSQLVVLDEEIKDYYCSNPIEEEATFTIETTFIPFNTEQEKEVQQKELEEFVAGKRKIENINWEFPITVKENEISQSNSFIKDMKPKSMHVKEMHDGFDLFKLVSKTPKRLIPLEERKKDIVDKIQTKKYDEANQKLKGKLANQAIIHKPDYEVPKLVEELKV